MKIVNIISTNFFGGPEKQILTLSSSLAERGVRVQTITFAEPGVNNNLKARFSACDCELYEIETKSAYSPSQFRDLKRVMDHDPPKFILTHGYRANFLGLLLRVAINCKVIFVSRGWTAESFKIRIFEKFDQFLYRFADHVVCVSKGQAEKVAKLGLPEGQISVIHNCLTLGVGRSLTSGTNLRQQFNLPENCIIVASAGRLSPEKNYNLVLEIASYLKIKFPEIRFIIFGEGRERPLLEKSIQRAGLNEFVFLAGFVEGLDSLFNQFDVFILTSHSEGLPNVILEAFAWSVPVVATDVGGVSEIVDHCVNGYVVPPSNPIEFSNALEKLVISSKKRKEMGKAGNKSVKLNFSAKSQSDNYLALFKRLSDTSNKKKFDD